MRRRDENTFLITLTSRNDSGDSLCNPSAICWSTILFTSAVMASGEWSGRERDAASTAAAIITIEASRDCGFGPG